MKVKGIRLINVCSRRKCPLQNDAKSLLWIVSGSCHAEPEGLLSQ